MPAAGGAVVPLDYEIDYASAARVRAEIAAAFAPGARALIVDMTLCTFADTAGVAALVVAHKLCLASDAVLGVVVPGSVSAGVPDAGGSAGSHRQAS